MDWNENFREHAYFCNKKIYVRKEEIQNEREEIIEI